MLGEAISGWQVRLVSLACLSASEFFLGSSKLELEHFSGFKLHCNLSGLLLLLESVSLLEGSLLGGCCLDLLLLVLLGERVDEPVWQLIHVLSPELLALGSTLFLGNLTGLENDDWG